MKLILILSQHTLMFLRNITDKYTNISII